MVTHSPIGIGIDIRRRSVFAASVHRDQPWAVRGRAERRSGAVDFGLDDADQRNALAHALMEVHHELGDAAPVVLTIFAESWALTRRAGAPAIERAAASNDRRSQLTSWPAVHNGNTSWLVCRHQASLVNELRAVAERAGLDVLAIEPTPQAMWRVAPRSGEVLVDGAGEDRYLMAYSARGVEFARHLDRRRRLQRETIAIGRLNAVGRLELDLGREHDDLAELFEGDTLLRRLASEFEQIECHLTVPGHAQLDPADHHLGAAIGAALAACASAGATFDLRAGATTDAKASPEVQLSAPWVIERLERGMHNQPQPRRRWWKIGRRHGSRRRLAGSQR